MRSTRGIALITVLLLTSVLSMMLFTLLFVSRQGSMTSRQYQERTLALYVAESGLAAAQSALREDNGWLEGFDQEPMERVRGSYTITFVEGTPDPWESVNNLQANVAADSHHGPATVPPRSALLVCIARVGTTQSRVEVLLRGSNAPLAQRALLASGKVEMHGNVFINGVKTLAGLEELEAGVHSNSPTETVTWQGSSGEQAVVTGNVTIVNPAPDAVAFSGNHSVGDFLTDQPQVHPPFVDVVGQVEAHRGSSVTLSGTNPTLSSGEHYHNGFLEVQGDLVLNGADLYVEGDLRVNGSITGEGSVYVTGNTRFFGDAHVTSLEDNKVALYSHGHVHLSGFNGTEFMNNLLASDPEQSRRWQEIQAVVETANEQILSRADMDSTQLSSGDEFGLFQDAVGLKLTPFTAGLRDATPAEREAWRNSFAASEGYPALEGEGLVLNKLIDYVENLPASGDAYDFMRERLGYVKDTYGQADQELYPGRGGNSMFNLALDQGATNPEYWTQMLNRARIMGYNRIGSAYFFGMVYTNGSFYADNEVSVIGSLVVHDDGSQDPYTPETTDNQVAAGNVYLNAGTSITFVEELFNDPDANAHISNFTIAAWLEE